MPDRDLDAGGTGAARPAQQALRRRERGLLRDGRSVHVPDPHRVCRRGSNRRRALHHPDVSHHEKSETPGSTIRIPILSAIGYTEPAQAV